MRKNPIIIALVISLFISVANAQNNIISNDSVAQSNLSQVSLDEVGLINQKQGGFSPDMWQGSDAEFIGLLLDKLPIQTQSKTISDLKKRLLLSVAKKPANWKDNEVFFSRLRILAMSGDPENVANILRKIPDNFRNEQTDSMYALALFSGQDFEKGCALATASLQKYSNMFWRKSMLACQASAGKKNELDLGMRLLKEDGKKLDEGFVKILAGLQKKEAEKKSAQDEFVKVISQDVFPEKQQQQPFPKIRTNLSTMSDEYLNGWLAKMNSIGDSAKRIENVERFYAMLASLGENITAKEWQDMAMYSMVNNIKIPMFVWQNLLQDAIDGKRYAEVMLIIIHILGADGIDKLSPELHNWIVYALTEIKMTEDAKKFVIEAMEIN